MYIVISGLQRLSCLLLSKKFVWHVNCTNSKRTGYSGPLLVVWVLSSQPLCISSIFVLVPSVVVFVLQPDQYMQWYEMFLVLVFSTQFTLLVYCMKMIVEIKLKFSLENRPNHNKHMRRNISKRYDTKHDTTPNTHSQTYMYTESIAI